MMTTQNEEDLQNEENRRKHFKMKMAFKNEDELKIEHNFMKATLKMRTDSKCRHWQILADIANCLVSE